MAFSLSVLNKKLGPGLTYNIQSGEYNNKRIIIVGEGTKDKPITINGNGVYITDKTTINFKGKHIIFSGFTFKNLLSKNPIRLTGSNIRFTGNIIEEIKNDCDKIIDVIGMYNRIDNNKFRTLRFKGDVINIECSKQYKTFTLVDNNDFSDRFTTEKNKNGFIINVGNQNTYLYQTKSIIYNNIFSNCMDCISIKSCLNVITYNKFIGCDGFLCINGKCNTFTKNYLNGCNKKDSYGIKFYDTDHIILSNTFENITSQEPKMAPLMIMCGVSNINVYNNDFINCFVCIAIGNDKKKTSIIPDNMEIKNNRIIKCNYMFCKQKNNYGKKVIITNNKPFNYNQKINLYTGKNFEEVDFEKFYNSLSSIEQTIKPIEPIKPIKPIPVPVIQPVKDDNIEDFVKTFKEIKLLKENVKVMLDKIVKLQKNMDSLIKKI